MRLPRKAETRKTKPFKIQHLTHLRGVDTKMTFATSKTQNNQKNCTGVVNSHLHIQIMFPHRVLFSKLSKHILRFICGRYVELEIPFMR